MGEFNVNQQTGELEQTAGMPSEYPATQVMMSDGTMSVEDKLDELAEADNTTITASYFTSNLIFSRVGKIGFFNYNGDISSIPAGDLGKIGTIPEGYRPLYNFKIMSMTKDKHVQLSFSTNGDITGYNYDTNYSSVNMCKYSITAYPLA